MNSGELPKRQLLHIFFKDGKGSGRKGSKNMTDQLQKSDFFFTMANNETATQEGTVVQSQKIHRKHIKQYF
ncbi:MAG: hypothetical protein J6W75_07300 [Bacteroidaceae bacterium]|nr:hypothetical protein [Bacteroidaceae bacterium]